MVDNYLFLEPLIIERLRSEIPDFIEVVSAAGLAEMSDENPVTPSAYVIYLGDVTQTTPAATGGTQRNALYITQRWLVVICTYTADGRGLGLGLGLGLGQDMSSTAGPLMTKVIRSLVGWVPSPRCRPLARSEQQVPADYGGGYGYYSLIFNADIPNSLGGYK